MGIAADRLPGKKNEENIDPGKKLTGTGTIQTGIEDLLAEGLLMGLSRSDWSALTPKQYLSFRDAWHRRIYENEKSSWERTRWAVFRAMCPPDKKKIAITDLIKFPWEDAPEKKETKKESKKRFEELKELWHE